MKCSQPWPPGLSSRAPRSRARSLPSPSTSVPPSVSSLCLLLLSLASSLTWHLFLLLSLCLWSVSFSVSPPLTPFHPLPTPCRRDCPAGHLVLEGQERPPPPLALGLPLPLQQGAKSHGQPARGAVWGRVAGGPGRGTQATWLLLEGEGRQQANSPGRGDSGGSRQEAAAHKTGQLGGSLAGSATRWRGKRRSAPAAPRRSSLPALPFSYLSSSFLLPSYLPSPLLISLPPCTYPRLAFSLSFSLSLSPLPHPSSSSIDQSPQL